MAEATLTPDVPYWFKQRQAKIVEVGPATYKASGPNLPEAVIGVRMTDDLRWQAFLKATADGPELGVSPQTYATARDAFVQAFELYRGHVLV